MAFPMCMIVSPKTSSIIHSLYTLDQSNQHFEVKPVHCIMHWKSKFAFETTWMKNHQTLLKIPVLSVIGRFPNRSIKVMHSHNHKHCIWPDACMHGPSMVTQCCICSWLQHLFKKEVLCNCNSFNRRLLTGASARSSSKVFWLSD